MDLLRLMEGTTFLWILSGNGSGRESGSVLSKDNLVVDKNSWKVLYAEAGKNFVDFLFNLLTLPVGTVIMQLTEKGMMGCLGDLSVPRSASLLLIIHLLFVLTSMALRLPLSTMSIVDLLNKPNINEVGGELEETLVDFTMLEGLKLLTGIYED
ncbi:hypothetical protein CK203_010328 [Vitis vinifera]|uniref:Uncharacterized protein n=1 Tax=Vitis vinifera TaxID=29760 RepID=A0A438JY21_VITVI|nr:hypothetical protein CK203_111154 [Vitis vinifera]RVX13857.1 hypothetical protein CK203_010328 [Vitis vinifera]